jgi:hypothetical protein
MIKAAIQFIEINYPSSDSFDNKRRGDKLRFQIIEMANIIGKLRLLAETKLLSLKDLGL